MGRDYEEAIPRWTMKLHLTSTQKKCDWNKEKTFFTPGREILKVWLHRRLRVWGKEKLIYADDNPITQ